MLSDAYAAGFFDGEGGVALNGTRRVGTGRTNRRIDHIRWTRRAYVGNTDVCVLGSLRARFGGTTVPWNRGQEGRKPVYMWNIYNARMVAFLEAIRPHSIVKARRIDLLLEFCSTLQRSGSRGLPEGVAKRRVQIYEELRLLNHRGTASIDQLSLQRLRA